jgi:hypothetical protein
LPRSTAVSPRHYGAWAQFREPPLPTDPRRPRKFRLVRPAHSDGNPGCQRRKKSVPQSRPLLGRAQLNSPEGKALSVPKL